MQTQKFDKKLLVNIAKGTTAYEVSCDTCAYLFQKRIVGRMRNMCGLYKRLRNDEVIIPNPQRATCRCHIEKQR